MQSGQLRLCDNARGREGGWVGGAAAVVVVVVGEFDGSGPC